MNHRGQRALRDGDWKYLRVDGNDYLFNIPADERERANLGSRHPAPLAELRSAWEAWNATMPAIPEDATVSLGYSALSSSAVVHLALPLMRELADATGVAVSLGMRDGLEMVYVARFISAQFVPVHMPIGSRIPMYCSASGRACCCVISSRVERAC